MAEGTQGAVGHPASEANNPNAANGPPSDGDLLGTSGVNRKKQKRRQKQAAKQAATEDGLEREWRELAVARMWGRREPGPNGEVANRPHFDPQYPLPTRVREVTDAPGSEVGNNPIHPHNPDDDDNNEHDDEDEEEEEEEEIIHVHTENCATQHDQTCEEVYDRIRDHLHDSFHKHHCTHNHKLPHTPIGNNMYPSPSSYPQPPTLPRDSMHPHQSSHHTVGPVSSVPSRPGDHLPNGDPNRIWNTSSAEERERIKEFWQALGEDERKSLVKIEREAVLRKMKEQQKSVCGCAVCGRKRTAIEEELEVLYDAYYDELEQYASDQQEDGDRKPIFPYPKSMYQHPNRLRPDGMPLMQAAQASRGNREHPNDEIEAINSDVYSDDGYEEGDDRSDESADMSAEMSAEMSGAMSGEMSAAMDRNPSDFFHFGKSLTVKGGILTVADDLLKNDGKKFIEMMEHLAERRVQREQDATYSGSGHSRHYAGHHNGHTHSAAPPEEDEYEDEDEEDYNSEEYEEEEDEMATITEDQRMEEGRRMFQIFAARMFEQRVLTAYREKVAAERQQKLIEELEEEEKGDVEKKAKKERDAQKKKEKKQKAKQAQAEEKARKEAEKQAEESAVKALEAQKLEDQKKKREEQRKKKEMDRKALEEGKRNKVVERLRRQQEERDRQLDVEKKLRDQKLQEKKVREDVKRKEREDREIREKEAKERKAHDDKQRRDREERLKAEREAREERLKAEKEAREERLKAEKEAREIAQKEVQERARHAAHAAQQLAAQKVQAAKRAPAAAVAVPPGLQLNLSSLSFPQGPVTTPAIPKAPTPVRAKQSSQHGSKGSSPKTPQVPIGQATTASPNSAMQSQRMNLPKSSQPPNAALYTTAQLSPQRHHIAAPPGMTIPPGFVLPPAMNGFQSTQLGPMNPSLNQRPPIGQNIGAIFPPHPPAATGQFRQYASSSIPQAPPGMPATGMTPIGRVFAEAPLGFPPPLSAMGSMSHPPGFGPVGRDVPISHASTSQHGRQGSGSSSYEQSIGGAILRPAPIQRPSSVKPFDGGRDPKISSLEIDELSNHLGSSALLDESDEPIMGYHGEARRISATPGLSRTGSNISAFASPVFTQPNQRMDAFSLGSASNPSSTWSTPSTRFGQANAPQTNISPAGTWSMTAGGWPAGTKNHDLNLVQSQTRPRPLLLRVAMCSACRKLKVQMPTPDGFHNIAAIFRMVEHAVQPPPEIEEILGICDTEGTALNGGGAFAYKRDASAQKQDQYLIRFTESSAGTEHSAIGEIGSPIVGHSRPSSGSDGTLFFPGLGAHSTGFH